MLINKFKETNKMKNKLLLHGSIYGKGYIKYEMFG